MPKRIKVKPKTKKVYPVGSQGDSFGEAYWRCKKCGDEIYWNTHKQMTYCKYGALGVDGCEYYVRLIGNEADREEIRYRKI